jgi:uncharacterized protein (TIGR03437 family)
MRRLSGAVALAALVAIFSGTALQTAQAQESSDIPGNKPAKVTWSPSRIVNADLAATDEPVEGEEPLASTFVVSVSADKLVEGAELWVSGSLSSVLEWDPTPFDIPEGGAVEVEFTLLQTPDEAGRTLGGTVHVRAAGKNLAKPLSISLKKSVVDDDDGDDGEGEEDPEDEDGTVDDEGNLPVSWSLAVEVPAAPAVANLDDEGDDGLFRVTPDMFDELGLAEVLLTANRDLEDVLLWLTPSLRDCVAASFSIGLLSEEGVLEFDDTDVNQRKIAFIAAGVAVPVTLELLKTPEELENARGGTLHVRSYGKSRRTYPAVLGFALGAEEEDEEVAPSAVVDGANFELSALAPSQIVSIFGLGLGPEDLVEFELDEDGSLPDNLGGVMVLFDGYIAPLLAAGRGQINAIVPAKVKGHHADIVVINKGKASAPITVDVIKVSPRIFTAFGTGTGQAAAVNPQGVLNGGSTPASEGSVLSIWITGVGATVDPNFEPGVVADEVAPLAHEIRVFVGGIEAEVIYAGAAPGMVGAVAQINFIIGAGTPSGPQPILIIVGESEVPSPETTTLEIE